MDQVPARSWKRVITQPAYLTAPVRRSNGLWYYDPRHDRHAAGHVSSCSPVGNLYRYPAARSGDVSASFFTGKLISRFGSIRIMLADLLYGCHIALALTGTGFSSFASALIFVGLGWNFPLYWRHGSGYDHLPPVRKRRGPGSE
ncbi:MAG: hypothetical protein KJJ56_16755 [Serratia rubidaea]|nr:hypothetical protein [Serratia rubidaea]